MSIDEHEEKETLQIDILAPGHEKRTTSELFKKTRKELLAKTPRCFICNRTAEESGEPLEAHHLGIEWQFALGDIDWDLVKQDFPHFDWKHFDPSKPYEFVDNMNSQGLILCKEHHTGKDTGVHNTPFPLWIMQRYLKNGDQWSPTINIIHEDE